jgi:WG containing repeat
MIIKICIKTIIFFILTFFITSIRLPAQILGELENNFLYVEKFEKIAIAINLESEEGSYKFERNGKYHNFDKRLEQVTYNLSLNWKVILKELPIVNVKYLNRGYLMVELEKEKFRFYELGDSVKLLNEFEFVNPVNEKYAIVSNNNKYGIFDHENNRFLINLQYDNLKKQGDWFVALKNNLYGVIDYENKMIVPFISEIDLDVSSNQFLFKKNGLYGIYEIGTGVKIPPYYKKLENFESDSLAVFSNHTDYGLINTQNQIVLRESFYKIQRFDTRLKGRYYTSTEKDKNKKPNNKIGLLNTKGKIIIPDVFSEIIPNTNFFQFMYHCKESNGFETLFNLNSG